MSGPKEVIWRMLTRSMFPHVANDGIVGCSDNEVYAAKDDSRDRTR